ncbi:YitT family protein [Thermaerobacter sp. PB12/4term]|uniref:YitT family protein n=1 Tax=Thermaerobacter sp. PB12/4term TaxID=2293838 RepID=UPI000E32C39D|nr:YitT family protein [Thermaerobacter sp. PB12/4term]QIA27821.1 YitT family protein [Thermaerobacter sp. PB12/4term]
MGGAATTSQGTGTGPGAAGPAGRLGAGRLQAGRFVQVAFFAAGATLFSLGINGFLVPARLGEGGLSGVSLLLHYATGLPVSLLYLLLNIPLFVFGWWAIGRAFILRTGLATLLVTLALRLTEGVAFRVDEPLLASLYGGAFIGSGIGLLFRAGASSGGIDIIARFLKERYGIGIAETFLVADSLVLGAFALTLGADTALYSILVTFLGGRVADVVQEGPLRAKSAWIVTSRPQEIARVVTVQLGRGATILRATGAWTGEERAVVLVVLNRRELARLKQLIREMDPQAFVAVTDAAEVLGEGFPAAWS